MKVKTGQFIGLEKFKLKSITEFLFEFSYKRS